MVYPKEKKLLLIVFPIQLFDAAGGKLDIQTIAARLVAPKHSLGNALADIKTLPLESRQKFTKRENTEDPFDVLQYLAEYERLKPGVFAIRDEEVIFEQKDENNWNAKIKDNVFPGIYRVALYIEGVYLPKEVRQFDHCCKIEPQRFTRVLQTEIALGIKPDEKQSRPRLHWIAPHKFIVTIAPTDTFGNIALPSAGIVPIVKVNGKTVRSKTFNPFTGEYHMEVLLVGSKYEVDSNGQNIKGSEAFIETVDGDRLHIHQSEDFKVSVEIFDNIFTVVKPKFIGDMTTHKAFAAGTREAMQIPLENRQPISSKKEAEVLGYQI